MAQIEVITNGDVLNKERTLKLFASGLSALLVSIYDGEKEYDQMKKLLTETGLLDDQYKIRKRYLPERKNFGISLSNRAGMMENAEHKIPSLKKPKKKACFYPNYTPVKFYI